MIGKPVDTGDLAAKFDRWQALVTEMHAEFTLHTNQIVAFTRLKKPLSECRVTLLSTGGVHRRQDPPFDLASPYGDASFRVIPGNVASSDLMVSHVHYDTAMAEEDIDCIFPIDAARTLQQEGFIGELAPAHYGMMGFVPNGEELIRKTGPELAQRLQQDDIDAVVLVPG